MKSTDLERPTVAIAYVLLSLELAAERGLPRERLLKDLDIGQRQLQQADARVSFLQYGRLCARILRYSGDQGLGYEFGLRSGLTAHGFVGLGLMSQPNVREAVNFAIRYTPRVRSPGFCLNFVLDGDSAVVDLHETVQYGPLHQYAIDMQLVAASTMLRVALATEEMELWFKCAEPEHYMRYRERLPTVRFAMGANQIRFAAALLQRPLASANAVTAELVKSHCERESSLLDLGEELPALVRTLLSVEIGCYPDLGAVAMRLSISPRTFKRRLHDNGLSYTQLVNEARERDAVRLLRDTTLTVEQIAERMGYSEAANFSRAFLKLTGRTPSALRARGRRAARPAVRP